MQIDTLDDLVLLRERCFDLSWRPHDIRLGPSFYARGIAAFDEAKKRALSHELTRRFSSCGCDLGASAGLGAASLYLMLAGWRNGDLDWVEALVALCLFGAVGLSVSRYKAFVERKQVLPLIDALLSSDADRQGELRSTFPGLSDQQRRAPCCR